jgi:hypothetical protein
MAAASTAAAHADIIGWREFGGADACGQPLDARPAGAAVELSFASCNTNCASRVRRVNPVGLYSVRSTSAVWIPSSHLHAWPGRA